ncbi:MFS transporter [Parapusillimonas granuli]|uniref:MFS transporter n=1 Tax=Parapusillimonas granuli TaxID=380911 RepID=A0A853FVA5_9BURK|nr:MFS transporter [Parapusillimonas granuli]MBB5213706.1 putative MFS family arabinose efflux permease [Parapusillimonas granuli]MEB2398797.1 MFS transporter [Alcaligenaceae bacterium]NYT48543.1 MFS transporter [Parapusillimonas granuli]
MKRAAPDWLVPIAAIFVLQTIASFLSRFIPIIAPAVSEEFGWSGSSIGYLTAANSLGGLAVLIAGSALFKRIGGMRTLQLTLFAGAVSMAFFLHPAVGVALAACFVMGLSNGAANPAGSEVLQRFSPPGKRNLVFSIKQAGVPLGGVIAGLLIPVMVAYAGWRTALFVCAGLVVLPTMLTWRVSARIDEAPAIGRPWLGRPSLQSLRALDAPLRSLLRSRGLLKISVVGSLFAVSQSCWFTFTVVYLIDRLGFSLGQAGVVFAVMQTGGVIGRIGLGWLSDYLRSATASLSLAALFSAATTALLGASTPQWPLWTIVLLAFIAGSSAASWNGVQIAEVARRSPPDQISETAAGSSILVNLVNMLAPTAFAAFVAVTGRYDYAFAAAGACTLLVLAVLPRDKKPGA